MASIIFADGYELTIELESFAGEIVTKSDTVEEAVEPFSRFTLENLKSFSIKRGTSKTEYKDYAFDGVYLEHTPDEKYTAKFRIHERTHDELLNDAALDVLQGADDETAEKYKDLYPLWAAGVAYKVGDKVRYNDDLYKVVQAHTSQSDWTPDATPSLYVKIATPGTIPEWVQPTGAHDAYMTGDKVTHDGKTWESTCDSNVWEPGVYGWDAIEA